MPARQLWHGYSLFINPLPLQRERILHLLLYSRELEVILLILKKIFTKKTKQATENADKLHYQDIIPSLKS